MLELESLIVLLGASAGGLMKPATPLRSENGLKLAVSCERRCHRFQARRSAGGVRWLRHPSARKTRPAGVDSGTNREKIRPASENRLILGSLGGAGRTFSRVDADGGEQGEFFRACGA